MTNKKTTVKKASTKKVDVKEVITENNVKTTLSLIQMIGNVLKLRKAQGGRLNVDQVFNYGSTIVLGLYIMFQSITGVEVDYTEIDSRFDAQNEVLVNTVDSLEAVIAGLESKTAILDELNGQIKVKDNVLYLGIDE